jgi:general secretion pathway protein J
MLVMLSTMALNQGLRQYHNLMERGINFWDKAKYFWLNKSLNSAVDYYVFTKDAGWFPYFEGSQEGISYVSLSPFVGNEPVIVWIRNERLDDGKRSLIYYELPVYSSGIQEIERLYDFRDFKKAKPLILLQDIQDVEVSFYGYDISEARWAWTKDFAGDKKKILPEVIRIDYREHNEKKRLVLGINTNSMFKLIYDELYPNE